MIQPKLFMDQLQPKFNALEADGDFGPSSEFSKAIRYSILDYKKLLKLWLKEYITNEGPWTGPFTAQATLWEDGSYTGTNPHTVTNAVSRPYNHYKLFGGASASALTGNTFDVAEFHDFFSPVDACPIDADTGLRETADLVEFANGVFGCTLDLARPAFEEDKWENVQNVWLPFSIGEFGAPRARHAYDYTCRGSEVRGVTVGGPPINDNVLGIDYTVGDTIDFGIPSTGSIPIGDGTTSIFLWSPAAGQQRFILDSLNSRVGLDV